MRAALVLVALLAAAPVSAEELGPVAGAAGAPFDLDEIQGVLAMQRLDAWLLYDGGGTNPVALEVVRPAATPSRRWFLLVPQKGEPVALIHRVDATAFAALPGRRIEYAGYRELDVGLKVLLKGRKRVAMEYSPQASLPDLSRVDAGTAELIRARGVEIVSSAELVQATRARWGAAGRVAHYVAVHHLTILKDEALARVASGLAAGVRESDVAAGIAAALVVRGLEAGPVVVAAGAHTADPGYVPRAGQDAVIKKGDLVLISIAARQAGSPDAIFAEISWLAVADTEVPTRFVDAFAACARAREAAVGLIDERARQKKPLRGHEVDAAARAVLDKGGVGDRVVHPTGHSLGPRLRGDGANLDDFDTRDARMLLVGAGFTVEPGVYFPGDFGLRAEINVFIGPDGVEQTTTAQTEIQALLK